MVESWDDVLARGMLDIGLIERGCDDLYFMPFEA